MALFFCAWKCLTMNGSPQTWPKFHHGWKQSFSGTKIHAHIYCLTSYHGPVLYKCSDDHLIRHSTPSRIYPGCIPVCREKDALFTKQCRATPEFKTLVNGCPRRVRPTPIGNPSPGSNMRPLSPEIESSSTWRNMIWVDAFGGNRGARWHHSYRLYCWFSLIALTLQVPTFTDFPTFSNFVLSTFNYFLPFWCLHLFHTLEI